MRVRRPSAAMVVAGLALVLASSGTTLAASRYLVTSTSQIKPSVLHSLAKSARGEINEGTSPWVLAKPGFPAVWGRVQCPSGTHVVSGGYEGEMAPGVTVQSSHSVGNGWSVLAYNSANSASLGNTKLRVHVLCLSGTP